MTGAMSMSSALKAWAIIPKVGGSLSLIGSAFLLRDVGRKWENVPLTTEVLAQITIANMFIAFWECFLSTWMVPKDSSSAYMASGNMATCNVQGFIAVVSFICLEISYTILSVLYWIVVARGWNEQKTQRRMIRFFFLGVPLVIGISFGIALLFMNMYNFTGVYSCFIEEFPLDCDMEKIVDCKRGGTARDWQAALFVGVLLCTIVIIVFMILLVKAVRAQESKGDRYLTKGQSKRREMTNKTFWQSIRYISVFFISNLPFYIYAVFDMVRKRPPLWVVYIYATVWPLFGVFNSLAYFRPKYLSYRQRNTEKSNLDCLLAVMNIDLSCCCCCFNQSSDESVPPKVHHLIDDEDLSSPLFQDERSFTGSV